MRLLVSVRAAHEVPAALAGGADIIDAKDPARGSLGTVSPEVLRAIAARVPGTVPMSVALGDCVLPEDVARAIAGTSLPARAAPLFLKLGFAGERSAGRIAALIEAGLRTASVVPSAPVFVPVAYADHERAASAPPEAVLDAALESGARALLVDTAAKDGGTLLDWCDLVRLRRLAARAHAGGAILALAGRLDRDAVPRVAEVADVIGVRGAACRGGREGEVEAELVRSLAASLYRRPRGLAPAC
jgi:(5-formylfuran-3-yl)methyl phosphate synthase